MLGVKASVRGTSREDSFAVFSGIRMFRAVEVLEGRLRLGEG